MAPPGVVFFLHLPKTGGTTLREIVRRKYPRGSVVDLNDVAQIEAFKRDWQANRESVRAIQGHLTIGMHRWLDVPCRYVTLLRDPVERLVSEYFWLRRNPTHPHHALAMRSPIDEWALSDLDPDLDNGQTRLLSSLGPDPHRACDESFFEEAERNLRSSDFAVVGITERFDETLVLLQATLGWSAPRYTPSNVSLGRPAVREIDPAAIAVIEQRNRFDRALYTVANDLMNERITELGGEFATRLSELQRANRWSKGVGYARSRVDHLRNRAKAAIRR